MNRELVLVAVLAGAIAVVSATDHAGGWNDGSRLATVESLVDDKTWAIDGSIFVSPRREPYGPCSPLNQTGTLDRLFINGRFYSDKSPAPAALMAGVYAGFKAVLNLDADDNPARFCWWMTLATSGLAYVVAILCIHSIACRLGLSTGKRWLLTAGFALASLALPYNRFVNNHILQLATTAAAIHGALAWQQSRRVWPLIGFGMAVSLGYTIDLAVGPAMFAVAAVWVAITCLSDALTPVPSPAKPGEGDPVQSFMRRRGSFSMVQSLGLLGLFTVSSLPWLLLHHGLTYHIAGTFSPANAHPEYFQWPGNPFDLATLTGKWSHRSIFHFVAYSLDLLFGRKGLMWHTLPFLPAIFGFVAVWRNAKQERSLILLATGWFVGVWFLDASTSRNWSGICLSVRWFVPLVAPMAFLTALWLRDHDSAPVIWLTAFGAILMIAGWVVGPWAEKVLPGFFFWPIVAVAGIGAWWIHTKRMGSASARLGRQDSDGSALIITSGSSSQAKRSVA